MIDRDLMLSFFCNRQEQGEGCFHTGNQFFDRIDTRKIHFDETSGFQLAL